MCILQVGYIHVGYDLFVSKFSMVSVFGGDDDDRVVLSILALT